MSTRILHVVSSLERGGIEIWLIDVLRRMAGPHYQIDFLVLGASEGALAPDARDLGSRIITCPHHRNLWKVWRIFSETLRRNGPYDVVHCHSHHFSGFIVRLASFCQVPIRIVHSHNDTRAVEAPAGWARRLYLSWMKHWIRRYATWRIGVSRESAEDLFGPHWERDPHCRVVHCGLDLAKFAVRKDRIEVGRSAGLSGEGLVIGHVGRFYARKNHAFLLEVAAEVFARSPDAELLSLGDGPLMTEIQARAKELGIADRIVFAGSRNDVLDLMTSVMDVFVLPSHHEGLSIALLEAQAAGLPCVVSHGLTTEGDAVPSLVHRLSLDAAPGEWASTLLEAATERTVTPDQAIAIIERSDFTIDRSVGSLIRLYAVEP